MPARDRTTPASTAPAWAVLSLPHETGRRRVDWPGLLRVASQDVTIPMSAHAPPPGPNRARVPAEMMCQDLGRNVRIK